MTEHTVPHGDDVPGGVRAAPIRRALLVDDSAAVRSALRALLGTHAGMRVVGEATNGLDAVRLARELSPDLVIMDLCMPRLNGIEATRQITSAEPRPKVIALSMVADGLLARQMLEAGAAAYVLKNRAVRQLERAMEAVFAGTTYVSPDLTVA
jgi:DNA-binding NarL/FixJ family response regulator